jgi:hypothetical protein
MRTPRMAASLLDMIRLASQIVRSGVYVSPSCGPASPKRCEPLKVALVAGPGGPGVESVFPAWRLLISPSFFSTWVPLSPLRSQIIGLLVEWDPTATALSDASYAGIGGWTPWSFSLMWSIAREDMVLLGLPIEQIQASTNEPATADALGLQTIIL